MSHNSRFQINDIVLDIAPENINIDRAGQIKNYKPIRTKGTAKFRSPSAVASVSLQVKFVGVDDINHRLRPLVAQFLLTPFCYVENDYLRDTLLGSEHSGDNMALALQNLTVSTVESLPDTWNVIFSFVLFNYKPYSTDFSFKSDLFDKSKIQKLRSPGVLGKTEKTPFQYFYENQLLKLNPVRLNDSSLSMVALEFLLDKTSPNPDVTEDQVIDLKKLEEFNTESVDILQSASTLLEDGGTDNPDAIALRRTLANFQSSASSSATVQNTILAVTEALNQVKAVKPNSSVVKDLLKRNESLLKETVLIFKGNPWFEFPLPQNNFRDASPLGGKKLYYRRRVIGTDSAGLHTGLVATSITMNFNHKLAILPLQGYQYPTAQHLGSSDVEFSVQMVALDDDSNRRLADFWNVCQNNLQYGKFISQDLTAVQVQNELFQFMGVDTVMLSGKRDATVPGHPEMYSHELIAVEHSLRVDDIEQITVIPTSFRSVKRKIWKAIFDNMTISNGIQSSFRNSGSVDHAWQFKPNNSLDSGSRDVLQLISSRDITRQDDVNGLNQNFTDLFFKLYDERNFKLFGQPNMQNIFLLAAGLGDEHVLGADGLNRNFNEILSKAPVFQKDKLTFSPEDAKAAGSAVKLAMMARQDRLQALQSFRSAMAELRDQAASIKNIDAQNNIVMSDGTTVAISDLTKDQAIIELFNKRMDEFRAAPKTDPGFSPADTRNMPVVRIGQVFSDLEQELISLDPDGDGRSEDNLREIFRSWSAYANATADKIIENGYLSRPVFKEAFDEYQGFNAKIKKSLYRDMNFDQIEGTVKQQLGLPDEITLEPDFYFWNETGDGNAVTSITPENVIDIKKRTLQYIDEVGKQNNSWYQKVYLQKSNPELSRFLRDSNPDGVLGATDPSIQGEPGLMQIEKAIDIRNKNSNAFTKHLSGTYTTNVNQPQTLEPLTQNSQVNKVTIARQPSSAEADVGQSVEFSMVTDEVVSAYGGWLPPMRDFTIRGSGAVPGRRDLSGVVFGNGEVGTNRMHSGTDLVVVGANGENITAGQPVYASLAGVVEIAGHGNSAGNWIKIRSIDPVEGEVTIAYMHLLQPPGTQVPGDIKKGQQIAAGQLIGYAGSTGRSTAPHLHFEVRTLNGTVIYPFGDERGDIVAQLNPNIRVRHYIPVPGSSGAQPATFLPNAGMGGLDAGLSSLDRSVRQLQASWNREAGYRMNRAYPSIYMAFVEEDTDDTRIFRFDDTFSFASIVNFYCVKDREVPADYVTMQLTNISGLLSNRKFGGTYNELNPVTSQGKEAREVDGRRDPDTVDTDEEYKFESLMLREGIKIEIRLGYSNSPENLPIVFVGRIVGVQFSDSDDIVEIELQSLATELVQDIKGLDKVEVKDGLFASDARTGPLLESLIASPECVSFGFWKRGDIEGNTNRDLLTDRWTWNPEPASDNIFAPPSHHLDPRKFFLGNSLLSKIYLGFAVTAGVTAGLAAIAGASLPTAAVLGLISTAGVGTTGLLTKSVTGVVSNFFGFDGEGPLADFFVKGPFSALSYYLYQTTIWDVFKEMEHRHPDCIGSPVPYREAGRTRMTMFFGNPDWLYFAKDPSGEQKAKTQEIEDRAQALKSTLENRFSSHDDKWAAMQDFVESADLSDELVPLIPRMIRQIEQPETDEGLLDDIDLAIKNIRLQDAINNESITPFRKYHIVSSSQHIIANNIRAKSSNTFNTVTINFAESEDEVKTDDSGAPRITDIEELTMKLDPLIPDEHVREAVYTYPNCQGTELARRYAVSHLQKACWQIYQGDLVILGNPSIKPYDIVYVYDEYSDMYGPIQVRRVTHMFDYEHGFITVITPDLLTTISEGATLSHSFAMGLAAEKLLGLHSINKLPTTPDSGDGQVNPWKLALAQGALGIASIFGAKKLLFVGQFGHPVRIHPLIHQGHAMVAGFGPPGVRENEFVINDLYQWFLTRSRAVADTWEDVGRMFQNRKSILNTRGSILSSRGLFGNNDAGAQTTGRIKK